MPFATASSRAAVTSRPEIVAAVAGHVDDPALGSDAVGLDWRDGEIDPRRSRCGPRRTVARRARSGEFGGSLAIADHHPFRDHGQSIGSCPFEEAQGDRPVRARLNGLHEPGIRHGCGVASALELELLIVDTARYIRRERDCDVDRLRARHRR